MANRRRGVFAAKKADVRFVPVLEALRERIEAGEERWGEQHFFPPVATEAEALDAKNGLYRARDRTGLSVQADYDRMSDQTFRVWVRLWTRPMGQAEITRRASNGEPLAYNVRRSRV
jgi:hypothetical protein